MAHPVDQRRRRRADPVSTPQLVDLAAEPGSEERLRIEALGTVYALGFGGPPDEAGIGQVSSFVWRFAVAVAGDGRELLLAFTSMPRLMAFTRALNALRPFTVPTEALHIDLSSGVPVGAVAVIDPVPDTIRPMLETGGVVERHIPELSGG